MANLEYASFQYELTGELPEECSRIYYGAEFCFWRMPPVEQLLAALSFARERSMGFTLVTPVIGEAERLRLDKILQQVLPALAGDDEVLISDWGALELIRRVRPDLEVILGRVLSGQKRGPRILDLNLTPEQREYFMCGSWHNREAVAMLQEQSISRIEQDNLLQGLAPLPEGLKSSLHIPYAMVTSSRNCAFRTPGNFGPCEAQCGEVFTLQSDEVDAVFYQDGNTQFLCNETIPVSLAESGIDRIVIHTHF